jgi:hypothetical protein
VSVSGHQVPMAVQKGKVQGFVQKHDPARHRYMGWKSSNQIYQPIPDLAGVMQNILMNLEVMIIDIG